MQVRTIRIAKDPGCTVCSQRIVEPDAPAIR